MKAPDKIYLKPLFMEDGESIVRKCSEECKKGYTIEYIHKDIVDETIKTAEDHAYFAGQEKFREKLMKWIQEVRAIPHENAIVRDLAFQEVVNKINSM